MAEGASMIAAKCLQMKYSVLANCVLLTPQFLTFDFVSEAKAYLSGYQEDQQMSNAGSASNVYMTRDDDLTNNDNESAHNVRDLKRER